MPINLVKTFDYILCWIFIYFSVIQCVTRWSEYKRDAIDWLEIDQLIRKQPTWFFLLIKTKNLPEKRVRLYLQLSFLSEKICLYVKSLDKSFFFKKLFCQEEKEGEKEKKEEEEEEDKEGGERKRKQWRKIKVLENPCCIGESAGIAESSFNLTFLPSLISYVAMYNLHNMYEPQSIHLCQYCTISTKAKKKAFKG